MLSGTPVSDGAVIGTARVIQHFQSEAHLIQKGDILVTRATDTGIILLSHSLKTVAQQILQSLPT